LISLNAALVGAMAVAIGAWPVVPFAGLEVLLVATAFVVVGRHDDDFELLEVSADTFRWKSRDGGKTAALSGNLAWLQVEWYRCSRRNARCLRLRYAGKEVTVGRLLSEKDLQDVVSSLARSPALGPSMRAVGIGG
jgi:uncharacterized membrane protein